MPLAPTSTKSTTQTKGWPGDWVDDTLSAISLGAYKPATGGGVFSGSGDKQNVYSPSLSPYATPQYPSVIAEGQLPDYLQLQNVYDPKYLNQLQDYATSTKDSAWLSLMKTGIQSSAKSQKEEANLGSLGAAQAAKEQIAMRGGLSTGAKERLESSFKESQLGERQKINKYASDQELQAELAENQAKLEVQKQLPGMEAQRTTIELEKQVKNISNLMEERERERQAALGIYSMNMAAWAAQQQAIATAVAGGAQVNDPGFVAEPGSPAYNAIQAGQPKPPAGAPEGSEGITKRFPLDPNNQIFIPPQIQNAHGRPEKMVQTKNIVNGKVTEGITLKFGPESNIKEKFIPQSQVAEWGWDTEFVNKYNSNPMKTYYYA